MYHATKGGFSTLFLIISIPCQPERERKLFQQYIEDIEALIHSLEPNPTMGKLTKQSLGDRSFFYCRFSESIKERVNKLIADRITKFYFDYVKKILIDQLIVDQYQSPYPEDLTEIRERVDQIISVDQSVFLSKKKCLAQSVYRFLEENQYIAIDGFFRFRTKNVQQWFQSYVQRAIEDYLLDREYREFIQLLKYFVSVQRSKFIRVHVIHKENKNFQLLKEDGTPILINELDKNFHEIINQSFSGEDFIVGALLSTAPEQVVLHTHSPEENIIRTLLQIFDGRITICSGCHRCLSF